MKNELNEISKKAGYFFGGRVTKNVITIISSIVFARILGATDYGNYIYILSILQVITVLSRFGLNGGLKAYIPKLVVQEKKKQAQRLISFSLLNSFVIVSVIVFFISLNSDFVVTDLLNKEGLSNLLLLMVPLLFFLSFQEVLDSGLKSIKEVGIAVKGKDVMYPLFRLIFFIMIFIVIGNELYGLVIATYISSIIAVAYLLYKIKIIFGIRFITKSELILYKDVIRFSIPLLFNGLLLMLLNRLDTLMIGYILTSSDVAVYRMAYQISKQSGMILAAVNAIFTPMISELYHKDEMVKLSSIYKTITRWMFTINLIAFSLVLILNNDIMMLFGEEFIYGSFTLVLIAIAQVINVSVGSADKIITMTGHPKLLLYSNMGILVLNGILNYFLIPIYGIDGAAIASMCSIVIINIIRVVILYSLHNIQPFDVNYVKPLLLMPILTIGILYFKSFISFQWYVNLIVFPIMYLIFLVPLYMYKLNYIDRFYLNKILHKFR